MRQTALCENTLGADLIQVEFQKQYRPIPRHAIDMITIDFYVDLLNGKKVKV